ncbi:MAG: hypothetical protein M1321_00965 [Candidatus Marsarchaeota archaeon]|jgi:hypothetical protein|nr:hypothetical protein [Candidatus Marsarchaeota archaeon]
MDFTHYYGSHRNARLKSAELFIILLMNLSVLGFMVFGSIIRIVIISAAVAAAVSITFSRRPGIRFVKSGTLTTLAIASLMVVIITLMSPKW